MKRVVIYMNDGKTDWVDHVVDVYETEDGDLVVYNDAYTYIYEKSQYDRYEVGAVDSFINIPLEEEMEEIKDSSETIYAGDMLSAFVPNSRWHEWPDDVILLETRYHSAHFKRIATNPQELTRFAKRWLDHEGYDITKRAPEIAPCPFCGGECKLDASEVHSLQGVGRKHWIWRKADCGYQSKYCDTPEEAAEEHNLIAGKGK